MQPAGYRTTIVGRDSRRTWASNTSKVISNAEEKGFVSRTLGKHDRRQMYFVLTDRGRELISTINNDEITLDELLEKAISLE